MCPNCKRPAIEQRQAPKHWEYWKRDRTGKGDLCRCSWEAIALAYKAQGQDQLAAIASRIAAQNRGEIPQGT